MPKRENKRVQAVTHATPMAGKLPPPGDIPKPPACSAHKYKIDVKERVVRADFSSSSSNRCVVWVHELSYAGCCSGF